MQKTQDYILDYTRLAAQRQYTGLVREHLARTHESPPLALVHSFGCQQNAAGENGKIGQIENVSFQDAGGLRELHIIQNASVELAFQKIAQPAAQKQSRSG